MPVIFPQYLHCRIIVDAWRFSEGVVKLYSFNPLWLPRICAPYCVACIHCLSNRIARSKELWLLPYKVNSSSSGHLTDFQWWLIISVSVGEFYNKMMTYMELNFASITYHHLSGLQVNSNQEKKVVILQKLGNDPVSWYSWNSFSYIFGFSSTG